MPAETVSSATLQVAVAAQLVTFLGVMATLIFAYLNAGRTRRWLTEDREFLARQTADSAATLARETAHSAAQLQQHTTAVAADLKALALLRADQLETHVVATKDAADKAYSEANHVNLKLEALGLEQVKTEAALKQAIDIRVQAELLRREKGLPPWHDDQSTDG